MPQITTSKATDTRKTAFFTTDKRSKAGVKRFKVINRCFFYTR